MVNKLETMRKQIEDERKRSANDAATVAALDSMNDRMLDIELRLVSKSDLLSDDKYYVEAYKVYLNLIWLAGEVGNGAGDVAGGADFRPTDASLAVLADIEKELSAAKAAFDKLMSEDVPNFNKTMAGKVEAIATK
jgi:hypothetical protein